MKQKALFISAVAALALSSVACSDDFFETSSKTTLNSETAYSNAETAEMALIGCYDGWQATISNEGIGFYLTSEIAADECFAGQGVGDATNYYPVDEFDLTTYPSALASLFDTDWSNYYAAIYRCNSLLVNESNIDWAGDETTHGRIIGECRGLRALLYFDLVRLFGNIPLLTEPSSDNIPQSTPAEVFSVIVEDLLYAIENIPEDSYNGTTINSTDGRFSKYAAEALLARVYLFYTGYYGAELSVTKSQVIEYLQDVIDNGGYELETEYANLWMPACTEDASTGDTYAWSTTYKGKYYNSDGWHAGYDGNLSKEYVLNLKFNSTQDYNGNLDGLCFQVYLGTRNVSQPPFATGWGISNPNPRFVEEYADDPRIEHSVVDYEAIGFESLSNFSNCTSDSREYTGYGIKKFAPLCFADGTRESVGFAIGEQHMNITYYLDWPIIRYADVLLMQAELQESATYLNEVQTARGVTTTSYSKENIIKERACEFAFEGIRYWDLLRYEQNGAYAAEKIAEMQDGVTVLTGGVEVKTTFDASNFTAKKGLMFIPSNEITLSDNVLVQNEGW